MPCYNLIVFMPKQPKWTRLLNKLAKLREGESLVVKGDQRFAGQLRSMLSASKRTSQFKWSVRNIGRAMHTDVWRVTKTGRWRTIWDIALGITV